jgi:hypothetical protein
MSTSFLGGDDLSFISGGITCCTTCCVLDSIVVLGAGCGSTLRCGANNTASGAYSTVFGRCNTASAASSGVFGGQKNLAQGIASFIGSGICNNACNVTSGCLATGSVVVGGVGNNTTGGTWALASCTFTVAPTICNAGIYSAIVGGFQNRAIGCMSFIGGGCNNLASGLNSTISGGYGNIANNSYANAGGQSNTASGANSLAFGQNNTSSGFAAVSSNGFGNTASGAYAFIGTGCSNVASAQFSTIVNGKGNNSNSCFSSVVNGCKNLAQGLATFIGSGNCNSVCNSTNGCLAYGAVVVGGVGNNTTGGTWVLASCTFSVAPTISNAGLYSAIVGGFQNRAGGDTSFVGGGACNLSSGCNSAVLGGQSNTASAAYSGAFGCGLTACNACTFYSNNFCACGSVYSSAIACGCGVCASANGQLVGYIASSITANRQTASYTIALTDIGKIVEMNSASANNLTIPLNSVVAFPIGTQIEVSQYGAGQTTIVATGGVTTRSISGFLKLTSQYVGVSLLKIGTDEWYVFGNLSA